MKRRKALRPRRETKADSWENPSSAEWLRTHAPRRLDYLPPFAVTARPSRPLRDTQGGIWCDL